MAYYAYFDPAIAPNVIGWFDTDNFAGTLPDAGTLFAMTLEQWDARFTQNAWTIVDDELVEYVPAETIPTPVEVATTMLRTGIQIASTLSPALDGTYPCTEQAYLQDTGQLSAMNAGLELPSGGAVVVDTSGVPHIFLEADFKRYCAKKIAFTQALNTIIGGASGVELPTLPIQIDP